MSAHLTLFVEIALIVLLSATLAYCMVLERRLKRSQTWRLQGRHHLSLSSLGQSAGPARCGKGAALPE